MSRFVGFTLAYAAGLLTAILPSFGADRSCDKAMMAEEGDAYRARLEERAAIGGGAAGQAASRPRQVLRPDLTGLDRPGSPEEFHQAWHNPPLCQGLTGQCWAFASTSFLECETQRLTGRKVKLSEWWTVYWEFVEKVRRYVRRRGDSNFPRGSEPNATLRLWQRYGVIPAEAYRGLLPGRDFYDDRRMYAEMNACLRSAKERGDWDEPRVLAAVRSVLDRHIGAPPETVEVEGARMTPLEYLHRVVRVDPGEYVSVMSLMQEPWNQWARFDVPDNWWESRRYYNVPLGDFYRLIRKAARAGGSACLSVDISEPGFCYRQDVAVVPGFDISSAAINDAARQMRFSNESTTDDHVVHLVGWQERAGRAWFLIKDSDTRPQNGHFGGYMFYDEDYIRLKALVAVLPRATVEQIFGRSLGPAPEDMEDAPAAATRPGG